MAVTIFCKDMESQLVELTEALDRKIGQAESDTPRVNEWEFGTSYGMCISSQRGRYLERENNKMRLAIDKIAGLVPLFVELGKVDKMVGMPNHEDTQAAYDDCAKCLSEVLSGNYKCLEKL